MPPKRVAVISSHPKEHVLLSSSALLSTAVLFALGKSAGSWLHVSNGPFPPIKHLHTSEAFRFPVVSIGVRIGTFLLIAKSLAPAAEPPAGCCLNSGLIAGFPTMFLSPMTLTPQVICTLIFRARFIFWLMDPIMAAVNRATSGGGTAMMLLEPCTVVGACIVKVTDGSDSSSSSSFAVLKKFRGGSVYGGGSNESTGRPRVVVVSVTVVVDMMEVLKNYDDMAR
jgi:hypothetical protein